MKKIKFFLLKALNIYEGEEIDVFASWGMSFLYRVCMVLGWTVLTAFFVANYGIASLPLLFALHALGNILGTFLFGPFISRFRKRDILLYLSIANAFMFGLAAFSYMYSDVWFLIFSLIGISFGLNQYKIVKALFSESRFSPSQATRVFPVIESAETLGVIVGGSLVAILSLYMALNKMFLVMMIVVLFSVPLILWYMSKTLSIPFKSYFNIPELDIKVHEDEMLSFRKMWSKLRDNEFVFYLFAVVILQYLFFGILEYQFTFVVEEYSQLVHGSADLGKNLAMDLGLLHTVFGALILFFQLFVASRIIKFSGIAKSMLVAPVVMLASILFMMFSFAFPSVVMARFNQELTYVLQYNAYHASYYALSHSLRVALMEFLEGVVRPVGTILATITIFILNAFIPELFNSVAGVISLFVLFTMFFVTKTFGKCYELSPKDTLRFSKSVGDMMNAMDLLADFEDKDDVVEFLKDLKMHRFDLADEIVKSIYDYISTHGSIDEIYYLMKEFESSTDKTALLKAINDIFMKNRSELRSREFTWHYLRDFYKRIVRYDLSLEGEYEKIQFLALYYLESGDIDRFYKLLKKSLNANTVKVFVVILESIEDEGLFMYLKEYLNDEEPLVRISFLMIFKDYVDKQTLNMMVKSCLISSYSGSVEAGLLYVLKTKDFNLMSLYEKMLEGKVGTDLLAKFLFESIQYLKSGDGYCFVEYLNCLDLVDLKYLYGFGKDWNLDADLLALLLDSVEKRIYDIYNKFETEEMPEVRLLYLKELKECYGFVSASKEYYMLKDMLS